MSVITFFGSDKFETSQTTTMAAIATYLSIEQNYRILLINTKHNDSTLEECFWKQQKNPKIKSDLETGISGLVKAISSNKATPEIITNYTRTIFKERLELLTDNNILKEEHEKQKEYMKSIISIAKKYYDLVFVDMEGSFEDPYIENNLKESDLTIINTSQRIKLIKEVFTRTRSNGAINKKNMLIVIGKYDRFSKYNFKNLQRTYKTQDIYGVPYNTMLFEATNDGTLADFIINHRRAKITSVNGPLMESIKTLSEKIIDKLKELQIQA